MGLGKMPANFESQHSADECKTFRPLDKATQIAQLSTCIEDVLNKSGREHRSLWIFVEKELRRFGLKNAYSISDVINEAYVRGIDSVHAGKIIVNPLAWLRTTCFNVIRELSRQQKKTVELNEEKHQDALLSYQHDNDDENELAHKRKRMTYLNAAFQKLSPLDQRLLTLKVEQGLPWAKIAIILEQEGFGQIPLHTLRKRKSRVQGKLRQQVQSLCK